MNSRRLPLLSPRARSDRGAVLIELSLTVVLLILLLGGMVDFSLAFWERSVMSDAARAAGRSAVLMSRFDPALCAPTIPNGPPLCTLADYTTRRYEWARSVARLWLLQNNLNPDGYDVGVRTELVTRAQGVISYPAVRIDIRTTDARRRFFFLPNFAFANCVTASMPILGQTAAGPIGEDFQC